MTADNDGSDGGLGVESIDTTPTQLSSQKTRLHTRERKSCLRRVGGNVWLRRSSVPVPDRSVEVQKCNGWGGRAACAKADF